MKEWNGLFGEFGQFCHYFDAYAELVPLPRSEEGGGGMAKQMYQRRFTKEGSVPVVEYFKGKGAVPGSSVDAGTVRQEAAEKSWWPWRGDG